MIADVSGSGPWTIDYGSAAGSRKIHGRDEAIDLASEFAREPDRLICARERRLKRSLTLAMKSQAVAISMEGKRGKGPGSEAGLPLRPDGAERRAYRDRGQYTRNFTPVTEGSCPRPTINAIRAIFLKYTVKINVKIP
jgi:hypothetical protein